MSIRLRLTILYSAILVFTLIVFGIVLYLTVSQVTLGLAKDALTTEARSEATTLRPHPDPDHGGNLSIYLPTTMDTSQASIQVRGLDGGIMYQSPDLQADHVTLPLDTSSLQYLQPGSSTDTTLSVGGKRLLVYTMPLVFQGTPVGVLQMARSLEDLDRTLNTLRQVLLLGGGIVTLLAFGAGWVLSGTALRPINRITQTAEEIGVAQDFNRRVDYKGPQDEIGHLAGTINTMLGRLQAAFHAQRRFVADASHELRTPLTSIRGNLGLLQREPPIAEADRVAVIKDLVSESARLSRLVGDLLTLARSDAGRQLRQEPIVFGPLLSDLIRRLAVLYPSRRVQYDGHPGVMVLGDPDALTQVLLILLDNALKFTPDEGVVTVSSAVEGGHVAIAVRDSGPGIGQEILPHIFDRFYQGDTARSGSGAGLGLAIAKSLVEGQRGSIGVKSRVGVGSVFTVLLPRASETASLAAAPEATRRGS